MVIICAAALAFYGIRSYRENAIYNQPGFAHGNGRLEATEVAIASKLSGRLDEVYVKEGDYVKKDDKLARMQLNVLKAELAQAQAQYAQALAQKAQSEAQVGVKQSQLTAAEATMKQKESSFDGAKKRFARAKELKSKNENVSSIKCVFTQTREVSVLANTVNKDGIYYFQRPGNMLLSFNDGDYIKMTDKWFEMNTAGKKNDNQGVIKPNA